MNDKEKAWVCSKCGILIYHTLRPEVCSCGFQCFYHETQITCLVNRVIAKAKADVLNDIREYIYYLRINGLIKQKCFLDFIYKIKSLASQSPKEKTA
jgi:hypothetical protein